MVLLICFDLPRNTKRQRRDAAKEKIIGQIQTELPRKGEILLYELPDRINNLQKIILGNKIVEMKNQRPQLHII